MENSFIRPNPPSTILEDDIYETAFLAVHGVVMTELVRGKRVFWEAPSTPEVHELIRRHREDDPIPSLTFARELKRIRSRMLSLRAGVTGGVGHEKL
jgi:hypothetical protein